MALKEDMADLMEAGFTIRFEGVGFNGEVAIGHMEWQTVPTAKSPVDRERRVFIARSTSSINTKETKGVDSVSGAVREAIRKLPTQYAEELERVRATRRKKNPEPVNVGRLKF